MALRGKIPGHIEKRLKMMVFGAPGSGKTFNSIMFPSPYLIDTEHGAENDEYIQVLEANHGSVFQSSDFEDAYKEVVALSKEPHTYKTLIIDSITVIYDKLIQDYADHPKIGEAHGRHIFQASKRMKSFINLLLNLDMNVIVTAHIKDNYDQNRSLIGKTFDGWKRLDFLFDLVLEIAFQRPNRIATVRKSRIKQFEMGESFAFSYEEIKRRYKGKSLEDRTVQAPLDQFSANAQLEELVRWIEEGALEPMDVKFIFDSLRIRSADELVNHLPRIPKIYEWVIKKSKSRFVTDKGNE